MKKNLPVVVPQEDFDAVAAVEPQLDSRTVFALMVFTNAMLTGEIGGEKIDEGCEPAAKSIVLSQGIRMAKIILDVAIKRSSTEESSTEKSKADWAAVAADIERHPIVCGSLVRRVWNRLITHPIIDKYQ